MSAASPEEPGSQATREFLPLSPAEQEDDDAAMLALERRMSPAQRKQANQAFAAFITEARMSLRPQ